MGSSRSQFTRLVWLAGFLVVSMAVVFCLYVAAEKRLDRKNESLLLSREQAGELRDSSDNLTRLVRTFVATDNEWYAGEFQRILDIRDGKIPPLSAPAKVYWELGTPDPHAVAEPLLERMRRAGITEEELAVLASAKAESDALTAIEFRAMKNLRELQQAGKVPAARRMEILATLYEGPYQESKLRIMSAIARFDQMVGNRTREAVRGASIDADILRWAFAFLGMLLIFTLVGIYRSLHNILGGSVEEVRTAIGRVGIFEDGEKTGGESPEGGSVLSWLDAQQNHLENLRAERTALRRRFEIIFEEAPIGIAIIDSINGQILNLNSKFADIIGYTPEEVRGLDWMSITHPDDIAPDEENMRRLNAGEIPGFAMEKRYFHRNGSIVWINMTIAPLRLPDITRRTHLCMVEDITGRKRREIELHDAMRQARAAAVAKDNFLAGVSHEIRTPLNGILGMTGILLESGLSGENREYLEIAHSSAETLLALVNDLLDFSKIEAGKIEIEHVDFDLLPVIESCSKPHRAAASRKEVALSVETADALPPRLCGDPTRLRQILNNLLSNAVKFTERGRVVLRVHPGGRADGVVFEVEDTGIGIPPEKLPMLFQKFTQLDASTTRRYGGTGLGLCISRQLAKMMGGDISVTSKPGEGSVFSLALPLPSAQPAPETGSASATPAPPDWNPGALALVVEDNPNNRLLLMSHLKALKLPAHAVVNGAEALGELGKKTYSIVLMDLQMPVMGGLDAAVRIRAGATGENNSAIPIVAVTANAQPEERARCLAAGMNDYLLKPFTRSQLLEKIRPYL